MNKQYYVYVHRLPDGTPFYVGMGKNNRAYNKWNRGIFWHAVVKKHCPEGPCVELAATSLTQEEAMALEMQLIEQYGRRDLGTGVLVNLSTGGDHAIPGLDTRTKQSQAAKTRFQNPEEKAKHSQAQRKRFADPEQRRKASEANKNNPKVLVAAAKGAEAVRGKPAWNQGIPASEEIKQKQSKAAKLRYQNPKEKEKVIAALEKARMVKFSKPYEFKERPNRNKPFICHQNGKTYKNLQEAALDLNLQKSKICLVLKGKRTQTGSFTFSYVESK